MDHKACRRLASLDWQVCGSLLPTAGDVLNGFPVQTFGGSDSDSDTHVLVVVDREH